MQKSRQCLYFTGIVGGGEKKAKEKKKEMDENDFISVKNSA